MPLHTIQRMSQFFGVRAVGVFLKMQLQVLTSNLEEVAQFLHLNLRQTVIQITVGINRFQNGSAASSHFGAGGAHLHCFGFRRGARLEQANLNIRQGLKRFNNQWFNVLPTQATIAAAQGWHRNGFDAKPLHLFNQVAQTVFDERHFGVAAPMIFGRKVDDVVRLRVGPRIKHMHLAGPHFTSTAGRLVQVKIVRPLVLELKCNPLAHHTNAIDRVDDGVNIILLQ